MTTKTQVELITAYKAAKIANEKLSEKGIKNIPPQMMYNYKKNNLIKSDAKTGMLIKDSFDAWLTKYIAKKLS